MSDDDSEYYSAQETIRRIKEGLRQANASHQFPRNKFGEFAFRLADDQSREKKMRNRQKLTLE